MLSKPSSCQGCPLYEGEFGSKIGYVPAHGTGDNGVLVILEAAGEDEAACGVPTVGRAGQYLWSQLQRVGIEREGFRIHNVLSCRPPDNKLIKQPYTDRAIYHCAPNLENTIREHVAHCKTVGKTPVIVALGKFAFKRLMGIEDDRHPIMRADYQTYPHWLARYGAWLMAADHPSHIMQGNHQKAPILQFIFQRALEVAADGLTLDRPTYLLDPPSEVFHKWVEDYLRDSSVDPEIFMSYDIETPYKKGKSEAEVAREDDDDYSILRVSFCYRPGKAVSVPWQAEYLPDIERIFGNKGYGLGWNNSTYDDTRIVANGVAINLVSLDGMLAWHVLNTSMEKALGFVTPFYWKNTPMWKHLSDDEPAFYNAKDADAALRCFIGTREKLIEHNLWGVFDRHVVRLNEVLTYMSRQGVKLDMDRRMAAENQLQTILDRIYAKIQDSVPLAARALKVYKKVPKDLTGLVNIEGLRKAKVCPTCARVDVTAVHFKGVGKKALAGGANENPCVGGKATKAEINSVLWAQPLEFKISKKSMMRYQTHMKHKPIIDRKEKKETYNIQAIKRLILQYPDDPLYPIIGDYRRAQKLLSTYIGVSSTKKVKVLDDYVLKPGEQWIDG